jgi:glucosamine kinase
LLSLPNIVNFLHTPLMMLIADSGSTKTSWILVNNEGINQAITTSGINPMYQNEKSIFELLSNEFSMKIPEPVSVFFYGAGCINDGVNIIVRDALNRFFSCREILINTDLLGAARSLCGTKPGIACILGTGSNSCYYDGQRIVKNISPLGYMLGDEGSGAVIGRRFISDLLKNQLPEAVREKFFADIKLSPYQIMDHVYKKPFPNRFLAQFTRFIHEHSDETALRNIVKNSFIEFFERNIRQYPEASDLPVQFTGSIAFHFSAILAEAAAYSGYSLGQVTPSPADGLIKYHLDISKLS